MDSITCAGLSNFTNKLVDYSKPPLRVIVKSKIKHPDKCIDNINILNSVLRSLTVPFTLDYDENTDSGGILRNVHANKSDVAIFPFHITHQRFEKFKISTPLGFSSSIAILSGKIPKKADDFHVFHTFAIETQIVLTVIIFTIAVMIAIVTNKRNGSPGCRFINYLFILLSSQLSQSTRYFKRHNSLIEFLINYNMLVAMALLVLFFKSHVLSNIIYKPTYTIDSMTDLANVIDETDIKVMSWGPKAKVTWRDLESSNETCFQKVSNCMIDTRNYPLYEIASGKVVYITYSHHLDGLAQVNSHIDLHVAQNRYFGASDCLIYNKNIDESIKESIDSVVNVLFESGLHNFWQLKTFNISTNIITNNSNKGHVIHLANVTGIFKVILVLQALSILILFIEIGQFPTKILRYPKVLK